MQNWKDFTGYITIKGKSYNSRELALLSTSYYDLFEKNIYDFVNLWISDNEFITQRTSGTTGKPKEIKIHKDVLVFSALNTGQFFGLQEKDKCLLCLPVEYIAGKMMIIRALVLGLDLDYQVPSGMPIISQKFSFCAMTPLQLTNSVKSGSLQNIEKLIIGGAPVTLELIDYIQSFETEIYETYGMSETASHIALKKLNGKDKSDYFTVLNGIEISTNSNSQLVISSAGLKINDLVTNDIVKLFDKNMFQWCGRSDNIINYGGIKLSPETIEMKLKPFIKNDFFIFGIKDEKLNEKPASVIEGNFEGELEMIFNENLNKFEIPKQIFYLDKFIRTDSGKVKRKETIELLSLDK